MFRRSTEITEEDEGEGETKPLLDPKTPTSSDIIKYPAIDPLRRQPEQSKKQGLMARFMGSRTNVKDPPSTGSIYSAEDLDAEQNIFNTINELDLIDSENIYNINKMQDQLDNILNILDRLEEIISRLKSHASDVSERVGSDAKSKEIEGDVNNVELKYTNLLNRLKNSVENRDLNSKKLKKDIEDLLKNINILESKLTDIENKNTDKNSNDQLFTDKNNAPNAKDDDNNAGTEKSGGRKNKRKITKKVILKKSLSKKKKLIKKKKTRQKKSLKRKKSGRKINKSYFKKNIYF